MRGKLVLETLDEARRKELLLESLCSGEDGTVGGFTHRSTAVGLGLGSTVVSGWATPVVFDTWAFGTRTDLGVGVELVRRHEW